MTFDPITTIIILAFLCFFCRAFYACCIRRRLTSRNAFRGAGVDNGDSLQTAQGLERSVIESFPVCSYNLVKGLKSQAKGTECAVCLTDFKEDEMLRLLPKCSHAFHPECIDTWLSTNTTCPLCRTSLLFATDSHDTTTDFGVAQPAQLGHQQVTVVVGNGSGGNDFFNSEATIGGASYDWRGHSLIMLQTESKEGNELYIVTADGVMPGLYTSVAGNHQPSTNSLAPPAYSAQNISKSERWVNVSFNPASFLRTFSMRVTAGDREVDGAECSRGESGSSGHSGKSIVIPEKCLFEPQNL